MKKDIKIFQYISIASVIFFFVLFSGALSYINHVAASVIVELFTIPMIILQVVATFMAIRHLLFKPAKFSYVAISILAMSGLILTGMILIS